MSDQGKYSHSGPSGGSAHQTSGAHDHLDTERLKEQGREAAHDIGGAAQHQAEHFYDSQRQTFAEYASKFTGVMKKTADEFDSQQQPFFSQQARKVADLADGFSHQLRDKDLRRICHDAQDYSRREPAVFIGGAIAVGFLVARFLRSSSDHQQGAYSERRTDMNASGSRYASQHPASGHSSSFESDSMRPGNGGAPHQREPSEPSAYGYGEPSRPITTPRPGDDPLAGDNGPNRSSR
ncbi:hypothetical protein [Vreelandella sp. GE22]